MGKKILVQRRGKGSPVFRAATHKRIAAARYPVLSEELFHAIVEDILHEPGRSAPLAQIRSGNGESYYTVAVEDLHIGQRISFGDEAPLEKGNVLPLRSVPPGTLVCNVERRPGDGGKLVRSSGGYATVVSHVDQWTTLKLPSKKNMEVGSLCRGTIGIVAGGGRLEKPFLKAGERNAKLRAKGQKYPKVKGVSMIAASHPHGGGRHKRSMKPTSVSRTAPPGQKVGLIAPKRTGSKKKK